MIWDRAAFQRRPDKHPRSGNRQAVSLTPVAQVDSGVLESSMYT